jgi:hypothetical protein
MDSYTMPMKSSYNFNWNTPTREKDYLMNLYDTDPGLPKRKNQSPLRVIVNRWGCLLGGFMLGAGVIVGLALAILFGPQLLRFDATATVLAELEIMLAATDAELRQREQDTSALSTDLVRDNLATEVALQNAAALLDQTARTAGRRSSRTRAPFAGAWPRRCATRTS